MYRVRKDFFDLQDADHWYTKGDEYPRAGYSPTDERIQGLLGKKNGQREPLIELVEEEKVTEPEILEPEEQHEEEEKPKKKGKKK